MADVREALRAELTSRGFDVASDTVSSRGEIYILGERDLAAAVFEFKSTAQDAIETMYHGCWVEGLPPRFAVLPIAATDDPLFELLEQMRLIPLLYEETDASVTFPAIGETLAAHL
jgi:hypothetical protein